MNNRPQDALVVFTTAIAFMAAVAHAHGSGYFSIENTTGPSAVTQGYGITPGGGSGAVYHVTHLIDGGPGSLRDGVLNRSGPRTIVFDVGGDILLLDTLTVDQPYLTIDGSTAPLPGITIRPTNPQTGRFVIGGTHDIAMRYLRFAGPISAEFPDSEPDLLCIDANLPPDYNTHHVLLDHLTLQDAANGAANFLGNVSDVTISWCMIYGSTHATDLGQDLEPAAQRQRFSVHHNAYARNRERNPQIHAGTAQLDYVNNIVYDFLDFGMQVRNLPGATPCSANVINNYFAPVATPYAYRALVYGVEAGYDIEDGGPLQHFLPQGTVLTDTAMGPLFVAGNVLPQYNYDQFSTIASPLPIPPSAAITTSAASELKTGMLPLVGTRYRSMEEQSIVDSIFLVLGGTGQVTADFDMDGDVDLSDLQTLAACKTRANVAHPNPACSQVSLDGDADVDQDDFGLFQRCLGWSGGALPRSCLMDPSGMIDGPGGSGGSGGPGGSLDYFVALNGNDNWSGRLAAPNGSFTDGPFRTLQRAANVITAGQTCIVQPGVYTQSVSITQSGLPGAPITFRAAAGQTVVLDGLGATDYGFSVINASWIVIDGFTVRNYRKDGIWLLDFADNITVRNCVVHGCGGMGIFLRGGDDCLFEYNEIYGNTTGIFVSWRDSNQNFPKRTRVRYNLVYDHGILDPESGDGIASDSSLNGTFEYNLCWNNRDDGMDVSIKSMNNAIRHNIALLNGYPQTVDGDGNGIKVSTNGGGGHVIDHNFALLNRRSGLDQDIQPGVPRNIFYSNTAYGNGQSGLMLDSGGRGDAGNNAIVKNNILASNNRQNIGRPDLYACCTTPLLESDYNLIGDGQTDYSGSVDEGPHSRTGDPKFVNPLATINLNATGSIAAKWAFIRNQILTNFALAPGSPCIGSGTVIPGITEKNPPNMGALE